MPLIKRVSDFVSTSRKRAYHPEQPICQMCFKVLEEWGVHEAFSDKVKMYVKCGHCKQESMTTFGMFEGWQDQDSGWELLRKLMTQYAWNLPAPEANEH